MATEVTYVCLVFLCFFGPKCETLGLASLFVLLTTVVYYRCKGEANDRANRPEPGFDPGGSGNVAHALPGEPL